MHDSVLQKNSHGHLTYLIFDNGLFTFKGKKIIVFIRLLVTFNFEIGIINDYKILF